jgi:hypothetical protein
MLFSLASVITSPPQEKRPVLLGKGLDYTDIGKELGETWGKMSEAQRAPYEKLFLAEKVRVAGLGLHVILCGCFSRPLMSKKSGAIAEEKTIALHHDCKPAGGV